MSLSKITVLITAYNASLYISKMFNSLLSQTNHNFSVIVCNDGSTDNTLEILYTYKKIFEQEKIDFLIIDKEHGGISSAINALIPKIITDYFVSADSDDWYDNDFVESFYSLLEKVGDFEFAVSKARYLDSEGNIIKIKELDLNDNDDVLYTYLFCDDKIPVYSGVHIFNTKSFIKYNNGPYIFDAKRTQNYQLLIPMVKHTRPLKINFFYNYLIRNDSNIHKKRTPEESFDLYGQFIKIFENVLSEKKYKKYLKLKKIAFGSQMRNIALTSKNKKLYLETLKIYPMTLKDFIKLILNFFK